MPVEWWFVHQRRLFSQVEDMLLPTARGIKPWESSGEGWVGPASGDPGEVVHQAQGTKCLNQVEFRWIEIGENRIALKKSI